MHESDLRRLNFSPASLVALNFVLAFVLFGVALDMKFEDFKGIKSAPLATLIGLLGQFVMLPAVAYLLVLWLEPAPSIALGMMLVAACPGGNISNFLTHYAKGNTALSITMTALSTAVAIVMTPLNLSLWGGLNPDTAKLLKVVALDPAEMLLAVFLLLGLPMLLVGIAVSIASYLLFAFACSETAMGWMSPPQLLALLFLSRLVQGAGGATTGVVQAYVGDAVVAEERAKALAAREGRSLTGLIEDGPRLRLRLRRQRTGKVAEPEIAVYEGRGGLVPGVDPLSNRSLENAADDAQITARALCQRQ